MVHLYGNVPFDWNVKANVPPGGMFPEFHVPPSLIELWAIVSLLAQVTVEPTVTVTGLGTNEFAPRVLAPTGIETDAGVGEGVGVVGVLELPHGAVATA